LRVLVLVRRSAKESRRAEWDESDE
jgi:hypothetical protein